MSTAEIDEIFTSYQGEGGSVRGSCHGKRQIFVRFRGCNLHCKWCDSAESRKSTGKKARVQTNPFDQSRKDVDSEMTVQQIAKHIARLIRPSTHSVSFTGGEPLLRHIFLHELLIIMYNDNVFSGVKIFLETNGTQSKNIGSIITLLDRVSVDIKDITAFKDMSLDEWITYIVNPEIAMIKKLISGVHYKHVETYAKMVVTSETDAANIAFVVGRLKNLAVPLVIQPVTTGFCKEVQQPTMEQIDEFMDWACAVLGKHYVSLSFQAHRMLNMP